PGAAGAAPRGFCDRSHTEEPPSGVQFARDQQQEGDPSMRNSLTSAIAVLALLAFGGAEARDDRQKFPIKDALKKSDAYKEKIERDIPLYFGNQKTPAVERKVGEWTSNKKTNAFNKSDQEACDVAFISAAAALQDRARREGGHAVVNIRSVY